MKALTSQIHLLEPLLATQLGAGEENSAQSFNYIPGSMLRGALVSIYLGIKSARMQDVGDPAHDPVCRRLFFDGTTCYLNAYPVDHIGHRAMPKPLSWYVEKEELELDSGTIYDLAVKERCFAGLKVVPGDYCRLHGSEAAVFTGNGSNLRMHNASEERLTKSKGKSTVYRYEAIAAGQVFGAVILSDHEEDLELLKTILEETAEIYIGGSRSAGYGRVAIQKAEIHSEWNEFEQDSEDEGNEGEPIILTLLSDLICRNHYGHYTTEMQEIIGCKPLRAFQSMKIIGGFNRKWGLPLVQTPALRAGSVFVYKPGDIDKETIKKYLDKGIGERRVEGFGRIAVNLNRRESLKKKKFQEMTISQSIEPLSEESKELARRLADRRLKNMLDKKLLEAICRLNIANSPQKSQLNRLRVEQVWYKVDSEIIINYLENIREAKEQFLRAKIGRKSFYTWLKEGVEQDKIWKDYFPEQSLPVAGITAEITREIKLEYTVRLLDALLKKTVKKLQEEGAS